MDNMVTKIRLNNITGKTLLRMNEEVGNIHSFLGGGIWTPMLVVSPKPHVEPGSFQAI